MIAVLHFLVHIIGVDYGLPYGHWSWYNFWSGFGSDLAYFGAIFGFYYKHNCHEDGCLRIGKHTVDGTPWCSKHHETARLVKGIH